VINSFLFQEGVIMLKEFKEFAMEGNMLDLAVGLVIGSGFSKVVNSLVNDLLMPPIGLVMGNADFSQLFILLKNGTPVAPYLSLGAAQQAGAVTLNYGVFVNVLLDFLIQAFALFMVVRVFNRLRREKAAAEV
jgi:large conductance mechanosensitive channel